jgi:hypothetical protein
VKTPLENAISSILTAMMSAVIFLVPALGQNNPIPQIVGPVHPDAVAPGSGAFTLSVYGANFVPGGVVNWNYQPRTTTYISGHELQAQILSTDIANNTAGYITVTNPAPGGGSSSASWTQVEVHDPVSTIALDSPQFHYFGGSAFATADFTHDGILDLVDLYFGLAFQRGVGDGTFQPGPIINGFWVQPTPFAYGDFNNDGNLDVALNVGQQDPFNVKHLRVMLGDGKGVFSSGPTLTEVGGMGSAIVTGDFNQDGNLDLMTSGPNLVAEFLGNGDGTFSQYAKYPYRLLAYTMQEGDFNGDGKLDLLLAGPALLGEARTLWIMLGNGDGTFQAPKEILSLDHTTDCGFTISLTVQLSDFNNDGKLDIAFCDSEGIGIMLGNGDGTFQQPIYYVIDTTGFSGAGDFTFAVGDINSDGKQDLIVSEYQSSQTPHQLAIFLGNGDGTFQPPQILNETPEAELGTVVGDFNSDGLLDVIFLSGGGMDVFLQK